MRRKKLIIKTICYSLMIIMVLFLFSCGEKEGQFRIGLAEVNYTPPVGLDMVGNYRGNDYASRGVHDSLYARAMVIENEKKVTVAFLTIDICKIPKETIEMMRRYISSQVEIIPDNIMISATHSHSGPKADLNAPLAMEYLTKAASAVIKAYQNMQPGKLSVSRTVQSDIAFNRRLMYADGKIHMSWEKLNKDSVIGPLGPADSTMIVLSVEQNGVPAGAAINFGCHATTLTGNNWLYTADYPGYVATTMKNNYGKNFIPLFLNGCCGNVTQVNYKRGFIDTYEECSRIGSTLGKAAIKAVSDKKPVQGNEISVSKEMVPVKRMTITDEQYKWAQSVMERVKKEGMPPFQADGIPDEQFAMQWLDMYKVRNTVDSLEVMVVRIGDMALVGLPGEMFNEFGTEIRAKSPFKNTFVMGLTNDWRKYFPTRISFSQGPKGFKPMVHGYETTPGATLYDIGAGEKLSGSAIRQLNNLNK